MFHHLTELDVGLLFHSSILPPLRAPVWHVLLFFPSSLQSFFSPSFMFHLKCLDSIINDSNHIIHVQYLPYLSLFIHPNESPLSHTHCFNPHSLIFISPLFSLYATSISLTPISEAKHFVPSLSIYLCLFILSLPISLPYHFFLPLSPSPHFCRMEIISKHC